MTINNFFFQIPVATKFCLNYFNVAMPTHFDAKYTQWKLKVLKTVTFELLFQELPKKKKF